MNTYRKKNYRNKRSYSGRPRRTVDNYHQPSPPDREAIPVSRHTLTKPDVEAVVEALLSGTLVKGQELDRFESLLAKLTHSDHAIALANGTAALHAALACLKLEPEDEVITSTLNHFSAANMIQLVGARPVFVDCHPETLTIDVQATAAAITENTKAILANNFAGHPADLALLRELCEEHNLMLIEDASHGLGGKYRGHYVGNQADITCFSFQPSMAITTCEGGAVTTNNRTIADWIRQFSNHGLPATTAKDKDPAGHASKLHFAGMNYLLSDVLAALGRSQLTRLDRHIERRRSIAQVYQQKLNGSPLLQLPHVASWADHAFHLYPVQLVGDMGQYRDKILNDLRNQSVEAGIFFVPVHQTPAYASHAEQGSFPNAEDFYSRSLCLPLYPDLSYKDIERITDQLLKLVAKYGPKPQPSEEAVAAVDASAEPKAENQAEETTKEPEEAPEPKRGRPGRRGRRAPARGSRAKAMEAEAKAEAHQEPKQEAAPAATPESAPPEPVSGSKPTPVESEAPKMAEAAEPPAEKSKRLRKVPKKDAESSESEEKPAKKTTRRKTTRTKAKAPKEETTSEEVAEKPKRTRRKTATTAEKETAGDEPKPKPRRTRTRKPKATDEAKAEAKPKTRKPRASTAAKKRTAPKASTPEESDS